MIGFEICQKLIYMIRDNQIESEWHPSVYAALDGIAGVVGGIEDNEIGAAIAELVVKDLLQSMVTGKGPRTKNGPQRPGWLETIGTWIPHYRRPNLLSRT